MKVKSSRNLGTRNVKVSEAGLTFSGLEVDGICNNVLQFHEFQDCSDRRGGRGSLAPCTQAPRTSPLPIHIRNKISKINTGILVSLISQVEDTLCLHWFVALLVELPRAVTGLQLTTLLSKLLPHKILNCRGGGLTKESSSSYGQRLHVLVLKSMKLVYWRRWDGWSMTANKDKN